MLTNSINTTIYIHRSRARALEVFTFAEEYMVVLVTKRKQNTANFCNFSTLAKLLLGFLSVLSLQQKCSRFSEYGFLHPEYLLHKGKLIHLCQDICANLP